MNVLQASNEGARGARRVTMEQRNAFKVRKHESRIVGRAGGFWI
ncbi:MAG TPA: hypothetical protein VGF67_07120 [Ktedonobacteraceae bacterium]